MKAGGPQPGAHLGHPRAPAPASGTLTNLGTASGNDHEPDFVLTCLARPDRIPDHPLIPGGKVLEILAPLLPRRLERTAPRHPGIHCLANRISLQPAVAADLCLMILREVPGPGWVWAWPA